MYTVRGIVKVYGDSITETYRLAPLHTTEIKNFFCWKSFVLSIALTYSIKSIRDSNMKGNHLLQLPFSIAIPYGYRRGYEGGFSYICGQTKQLKKRIALMVWQSLAL